MKTYRLFMAILAIIVIACSFGVQGQFQEQNVTPSSTVTPNAAFQYTQYYNMPTVSAPSIHISVPIKTATVGKSPATLYSGTQQPSLWVQGYTQYAVVPQGATVTLIAVSPVSANGYLSETLNGATYNSNFYFYPNSILDFYADTIGQHVLSFIINGQPSNQVVINVVEQSDYPGYYSGYYPGYYPGYNSGYYPWNYYNNGGYYSGYYGGRWRT